MPSTVSVTVGDTAIVSEVARVVRQQFPGASINEILRYCGLALTHGTREAQRMVFGDAENSSGITGDRVFGKVPEEERAKLKEYLRDEPEITCISDLYRAGIYFIAGESHSEALKRARIPRGRPRKVTQ